MEGLDFTNVTGVGVAALSVFLMWKFLTQSNARMADAIDNNTKALRENTQATHNLQVFLGNGRHK